jgi:uncharacterized protein (DUF2336 family)
MRKNMDLGFLDRSSGVTPLLVRLYDSHRLYGLAQDRKPMARAELIQAVSELLAMELSPRESELIADVLIELLRQAEKDLRQALSERLSAMDSVPLRLVLQIANDDIEVASPVLKCSPVLGDLDLIYIIKAKSPAYWQAIAARHALSGPVMNILAETKDFGTALALAYNRNITLSEHAVCVLAGMARDSEDLAVPLLRRGDVSSDVAGRLYRYVGRELKKYILETYDVNADILSEALDDIVLELEDADRGAYMPSASMLNVARQCREKGLLNIPLMMATLKRGQLSSFVAQFSVFTGLEPATILQVLMQDSGQGLAIACKACGISKPDFMSVYLLSNRIRGEARTANLKEMTRAASYYNRIDEQVARDIMRNSVKV